MNVSIPDQVARMLRPVTAYRTPSSITPDEWTADRVKRCRALGLMVSQGLTPERLTFTRLRLAALADGGR